MVFTAEQARLTTAAFTLRRFGCGQQNIRIGQNFCPIGFECVKGPRPGQPFKLAAVHRTLRQTREQIIETSEGSVGMAFRNDRVHRLFANVADARQRIAHGIAIFRLFDREFGVGGVDVRAQNGNSAPPRIVNEDRQFVGLMHIETHRCRVEFFRVMRLQPAGLIGEQRIGGSVALVEAISGEFVDQVEQLVRLLRLDPRNLLATIDEALALGVHFRLHLLAHGPAQQVGIAQRIARQHLRRLHHLFLIDENAVGFGKNAFQLRVRIFDRFGAVLAAPEQRYIVHWTGPIKRNQRDDIAEIGGLHRRQRAPHPFGFQLEHAHRVAALKQAIDLIIIPWQQVEIDRDPALFQQFDRLAQHRKRLQPEEVEFDEP